MKRRNASFRDQASFSNLNSASTSRHTSNTSIYSMPFHSRNSTPPTPVSSPGLYRPPSHQLLVHSTDGTVEPIHYLHPSQYRQADPVRETNQLETDYDPISGRKTINNYSIIEEIGRGTHGKVKLGFDLRTRDLVAIKIVERSQGRPRLGRKGDGGESSETKIRREIAILKKIRHENVVRLIEVIDDDRSKKVYLVLEYVVRGEVIWRKEDRYEPAMDIEEARRCFRDTVVGLDHLHWNGIIHRDIKPANLLWTDNKVTKISDFGVSFLGRPCREDDDEGTGEDEPTGYEQDELELAKTAGTPAFFAPELCSMDAALPQVPITSAIDVWALGVTLFCFIFGRLPFNAEHEFKLFKCIAEEELVIPRRRIRAHKPQLDPLHRLSPEELEDYETEPVDDDLRDLIKRLLVKNPAKRILLKEVKRHPWVLHGIEDPIGWVERTDPERTSHGNKIEVTTEDVETAVSVPSIVNRAKSAIRKAAGTWVRGLRKRGSSTTSVRDSKGKHVVVIPNTPGVAGSKQELQWLGGVEEPREDEKLNTLAQSVTNSSAASSETAHGQPDEHEYHDQQWTSGVTRSQWTQGTTDKQLRRKQSMNLLGANLLRRHSTYASDAVRATHRAPTEPPPTSPVDGGPRHLFKAESTAALVAPSISRRIVRSTKSDDLARGGGMPRKSPSYEDSSPLRARDVLSGALFPRVPVPVAPAADCDTLPTQIPRPGTLYTVVDSMEKGLLNVFPKSPDSNLKKRFDRQRREEQELARQRLGKINLDDEDDEDDDNMLDRPCPPSPDDEAPPERVFGQENQKIMLEEKERQRYTSSGSGTMPFKTPDGWSRESFYHPVRGWVTPPIAMAANSRRSGYFDPPSPKSDAGNLVSSSSNERFVNTAGSSLTNSTSFPSIATNPSSVSSDIFLNQYSRKGSFVPTENNQEAMGLDEDDRLKLIQAQARGRKPSELLFQPEEEEEDSGSDSEGGFVMKGAKPKRTRSITVAQLAREPDDVKDAAIKRGERPRLKHYSRSSASTVKAQRTVS
ncbi:kinase-like protein [Wilcoxina mikolae CBS 423.85]|nr:kinase-like protein [Wilcoxina mikolae CBS 423.85]